MSQVIIKRNNKATVNDEALKKIIAAIPEPVAKYLSFPGVGGTVMPKDVIIDVLERSPFDIFTHDLHITILFGNAESKTIGELDTIGTDIELEFVHLVPDGATASLEIYHTPSAWMEMQG